MTVQPNKVVSLTYELKVDDENGQQTLVEKVEADAPMVFLYGSGGLLKEFEDNLANLNPGDSFQFSISPEAGYGAFNEEAVVNLPLDIFRIDGQLDPQMLQPGNVIPMQDEEGAKMEGRVIEVGDDNVLMDFNHPLAGVTMHFSGRVEKVRDASPEELAHGHVHGEGGHHH